MKVILTICSKGKDRTTGDLPAHLRYKSQRIDDVQAEAKRKRLPLFILSGKYGLLAENDTVPYYDHLLKPEEVTKIATLVANQNQGIGITQIEFYAKPREGSWVPYYEVVERVAREQGITLEIVTI